MILSLVLCALVIVAGVLAGLVVDWLIRRRDRRRIMRAVEDGTADVANELRRLVDRMSQPPSD